MSFEMFVFEQFPINMKNQIAITSTFNQIILLMMYVVVIVVVVMQPQISSKKTIILYTRCQINDVVHSINLSLLYYLCLAEQHNAQSKSHMGCNLLIRMYCTVFTTKSTAIYLQILVLALSDQIDVSQNATVTGFVQLQLVWCITSQYLGFVVLVKLLLVLCTCSSAL